MIVGHPSSMDVRQGNWLNWEAALRQLMGSFVRCYTTNGSVYCGIASSVDSSLTTLYLNYAYIESSKNHQSQWPTMRSIEILIKSMVMLITDRSIRAVDHYSLVSDQSTQCVVETQVEPAVQEPMDRSCGFVVEIPSTEAIQNTGETISLQLKPMKKKVLNPCVPSVTDLPDKPVTEVHLPRLWKPRSMLPVVQKLKDEGQLKIQDTAPSQLNASADTTVTTEPAMKDVVTDSKEDGVKCTSEEPVNSTSDKSVDTTANEQVNDTVDESVKTDARELVNDTVDEPVKTDARELVKDAVDEPVNDTANEQVNDTVDEPVNNASNEQVNDTAYEQVNTIVNESVNTTPRELVNDTTNEPVNTTPRETVNNTPRVVNTAAEEPVRSVPYGSWQRTYSREFVRPRREWEKNTPKEPTRYYRKQPPRSYPRETVSEPAKKPVKQTGTQQVQLEPQSGPQVVMHPRLYSSPPLHSVQRAPPVYQPMQQPYVTQYVAPPYPPILTQLQPPIQQTVQVIPVQQPTSSMTVLKPMPPPSIHPTVVPQPSQSVVLSPGQPKTVPQPKTTPQSTQQVPACQPPPPPHSMGSHPPVQILQQPVQPAMSQPAMSQPAISQPPPRPMAIPQSSPQVQFLQQPVDYQYVLMPHGSLQTVVTQGGQPPVQVFSNGGEHVVTTGVRYQATAPAYGTQPLYLISSP